MATGSGSTPTRRPSRSMTLALAAPVAVGAAVLGAWIDWTWWSPVYGVQLVAIFVAFVAVLVAFLLRRRVRLVLPLALAATAGLAIGLDAGPSREQPAYSPGSVTVQLGSNPRQATAPANCSVVPSREHISVSTEGDTLTMADGMSLSLWVTVGDMWSRGSFTRSDHVAIYATITPARDTPLPDDGVPTETSVTSTPDSRLSATVEGLRGSVTFDGLVSSPDGNPAHATPFELSGMISWTCQEPADASTASGR